MRIRENRGMLFLYGLMFGMFVYRATKTITGHDSLLHVRDSRAARGCEVTCDRQGACEYADEVDLRIVVMSFQRGDALRRTLDTIERVEMAGDRLSVDIWIDRSPGGAVDKHTLGVARNFSRSWRGGRGCAHVQERHQHVLGQWLTTWRPKPDTKEIALLLEDDISVSRHIYRWLKAVSDKYRHDTRISTFTLQTQGIRFLGIDVARSKNPPPMQASAKDTVFMYGVIGTWGFAPRPEAWRDLQDWFFTLRNTNSSEKPYVPGLLPTVWYKTFEKTGKTNTVPEQWVNYYNYVKHTYTLYPNLNAFKYSSQRNWTPNRLTFNRKEAGVHFKGLSVANNTVLANRQLMADWRDEYVSFPDDVTKFSYEGNIVK